MPLRYVSVEKSVIFQGREEQWSNVYCYNMPSVSTGDHDAIADAVLAAERPVHGSNVTFKRTRVFTVKGLNGLTDFGDMFRVTERTAVGTGGDSATKPYLECALLVKWPLNRKVKIGGGLGRQRSLKKWIHPCTSLSLLTAEMAGTVALGSAIKATMATYAAAVRTPPGGSLCSPSDSAEPTDNAIVHPYLEHRQFPRGRKEET